MSSTTKTADHTGFTLVELLVVLGILGLIAGLIGPQVMKFFGASKTKVAAIQIQDLSSSLELYALETGRYPSTSEGLEALVAPPPNQPNWSGPYLNKAQVPRDPWGQEYRYLYPGRHATFDLWSLGADGREGGTGENADVSNWQSN